MSFDNRVRSTPLGFISHPVGAKSSDSSDDAHSELFEFDIGVSETPGPPPNTDTIEKFRDNLGELLGRSKNLQANAIASAVIKLSADQPKLIDTFNRQMSFAPTLKKFLHFTPSETSTKSPADRIVVRTGVAIAIARDATPKDLDLLRKYLLADVLGDRAEVLKRLGETDCDVAALVRGLWRNPAFLKAYAMEASV